MNKYNKLNAGFFNTNVKFNNLDYNKYDIVCNPLENESMICGKYEIVSLSPSFAHTIGNTLRRVLLSSIGGYAVNKIYFKNELHEDSEIYGCLEGVKEFAENLRNIVLKKKEFGDIINKHVINFKYNGSNDVLVKDVFSNSPFEPLLPNSVLLHVQRPIDIDFTLTVEYGYGFISASEVENVNKHDIPINALYSPVILANYTSENCRFQNNMNYEKLIISIETNGAIHPKEALKDAMQIIFQVFSFTKDLIDESDNENKEKTIISIDENSSIEKLALDKKLIDILKKFKINLIKDLISYSKFDLIDTTECTMIDALVIKNELKKHNFSFKKSINISEEVLEEENTIQDLDAKVEKNDKKIKSKKVVKKKSENNEKTTDEDK